MMRYVNWNAENQVLSAFLVTCACGAIGAGLPSAAWADEQIWGYVKGAETIPESGWEFYQFATARSDKGIGDYTAVDTKTEVEYGVSNSFNMGFAVKTLSIDTSGIRIDAYVPGDKKYTLKPSGVELEMKYNFLKPAISPVGLSMTWGLSYSWKDPNSGQEKDTISGDLGVQLQRYFMEGQLVTALNAGLEATYADRDFIPNLPTGFDWPTEPEMELELTGGAAFAYRVAPGLYLGVETQYQTEYETEVRQERWSIFAGPSIHYGSKRWWATVTWFPQIAGGGETYAGQTGILHLIEKTKQEFRLKMGLNF